MRSAIAALPPLREVIAQHGLAAKKSLGQNFLLDLNVTARIVREAGDLGGANVVEIGPGPGGLTRALLAAPAASITVIERDRRFLPALEELAAIGGGKLRVVEADALKTDILALVPAPRAVIANLPYNVATPLLIGWLRHIDEFRSLTLMFQKEVADRIVAAPRSHAYGRLSVIAQWRAEVDPLLTLPARAFTPPPKVDSTVVQLRPRQGREDVPFAVMEAVTAAAFGQRRKMLRASLRSLGDAEALLAEAQLSPTARAEEIDVAGFVRLARAVAARQG
ncbi:MULTISPECIES: 16S rRNA (adenine(1518)-N(6)/adenine(1519)-N(6))-dimethyltransferase RsmA [Inquilinus]|uniref:Ribosomal RNA small subunit methyltransferase A n=1 Tax=Inquilinus ginsengisoli TaxID=363840 RepID=A0ABU1JW28_9PROT|nr:16S rRNA (adenine(1518)-N(6)/adenine(1519)-N(6))-dimethyltransferase RsmA [Inquilinus ginsengisoli]MDR6292821.1 16S rRNA (adenine1518-N6/adenine1519-N6)-dimethyltransferase [Inquilinus ginsengisoli]